MQRTDSVSGNRQIPVLVLVAVLMTACASGLSREECEIADWHGIGYEDGVRGWTQTRIGEHRKSCAKHGVALNVENYRAGWQEGMRQYCQPANGYRQGRTGRQYLGVCSQELEAPFGIAYRQGRRLYTLETDVKQTSRKLSNKRNRLDSIEVQMRDKGMQLVADGISVEQRVVLLDELRKLEKERARTRDQIPSIEKELKRKEQKLVAISAEHVY